eukprot:gene25176-2651_t
MSTEMDQFAVFSRPTMAARAGIIHAGARTVTIYVRFASWRRRRRRRWALHCSSAVHSAQQSCAELSEEGKKEGSGKLVIDNGGIKLYLAFRSGLISFPLILTLGCSGSEHACWAWHENAKLASNPIETIAAFPLAFIFKKSIPQRILAQGSLATVEVVRAPTPRGIGTTEPAAPTAVKNNPITNIPASAVPAAAAVATASATRSSYSHLRYIPTPSSVADGSGGGSGTGYTAAPGGGSGRGGWTGRQYDYGYNRVPEPQPGPSSPAHLYASSMSSEFLPRSQQPRASPIPTKPDLVDLKAGRGSGAPIYP